MRQPKFWKRVGCLSILLLPFAFLYQTIYRLRVFLNKPFKYSSSSKVICVGNINIGGSGKTPVAIELGKNLKARGINFAYLSKGYGGNNSLPKLVKSDISYKICGDESILLSEISDTYICKSRKKGLKFLENKGYDFVIIDDGLQNPTIRKDFSICVINGESGFGNNMLFPSGCLRESLKYSLTKINAFVFIGDDKNNIISQIPIGKYVDRTNIVEKEVRSQAEKYIAFCGIANPLKFFDSLKKIKLNVIKYIEFDDHFAFSNKDLNIIMSESKKENAKIITTKKDWVRLNAEYKSQIEYLDISIPLSNELINLIIS